MSASLVSALVTTGASANVLLFLSQVPLVAKCIHDGDSTRYPWMLSLTLMATMSLWSAYTANAYTAAARPDLWTGNFSGIVINFLYLCIFAWYAKSFAARARIMGSAIASLAVTWAFAEALFLSNTPYATTIVGAVTCAVNATFFYAPLHAIYDATHELDARRVPELLAFVQLGQSLVWIAAGALLPDYFILGVNIAGEASALAQLGGIAYVALRRRQLGLKPGEDAPWVKAEKLKLRSAAAAGAAEGEGKGEGEGEGEGKGTDAVKGAGAEPVTSAV